MGDREGPWPADRSGRKGRAPRGTERWVQSSPCTAPGAWQQDRNGLSVRMGGSRAASPAHSSLLPAGHLPRPQELLYRLKLSPHQHEIVFLLIHSPRGSSSTTPAPLTEIPSPTTGTSSTRKDQNTTGARAELPSEHQATSEQSGCKS